MRTLRLIGRGLTDTLESLLPFTLLTLAWWVCLLPGDPGAGGDGDARRDGRPAPGR